MIVVISIVLILVGCKGD